MTDTSERTRDILIVDDNPENLKVLGDFFTAQGFNVRVARDGKQALSNAAAAPPEVILLDIHMPVMDGYETCTHLKAIPELRDTPVIFLSALGETFNKVRAFECGGADYITKPFNLEEVRVRVGNHLQSARLLAESRAGFRASFEQAAAGMAHLRLDGAFVTVNRRLCAMLGREEEALCQVRLQDTVHADSAAALAAALEGVAGGGGAAPLEMRCLRGDSAEIWCRATFSLVQVPSTGNQYISAILEDVTEHKRVVEERRRLAAALEQAGEAVAITDAGGVIQYVNPAYAAAFGEESGAALGGKLPVLNADSPENPPAAEIWKTISSGAVWKGRVVHSRRDGRPRTEEYTISAIRNESGEITNYAAVVRDLTQQLRLEEQLRQSQKMEAIGTLAAGIAHDFNNLLAAIIGYTELSMDMLPEEHSTRSDLQQVLVAAGHATELVRQILAFGRQSAFEVRPVLLQRIAEDALKLLRRSIPPTIEIHHNMEADCPAVLADSTAIHQIIMNLCTNAYHAMEQRGGTLTVRICKTEIGDEPHTSRAHLAPGSYVRMDISDTGHGMDSQTMQRIFEPYFTTKGRGSGTGLGLATVHGIINDLKGAIHVYSELGCGSTFTVFLPVAELPADETRRPPAMAGCAAGTERVLFIDDDKAICQFAAKALNRLGYKTTALTSPREALNRFRAAPCDFDVVITDEMMPELRGTDLLRELRAIRPGIPVILYSGFAETFRNRPRESFPFNAFVMKPMVVSELTRAIRSVMPAPAQRA